MKLTAEYIKCCDQQVIDNLENKELVVGPKRFSQRVKRIMEFLEKHQTKKCKVLDIGSGAYMPLFLDVTHAIDASAIPGSILKQSGWKGKFQVASCDYLPFRYKEFDIAICSEVLEHLPNLGIVRDTIDEIERVASRWIISTPNASASGFRDKWNTEPTHVQFFTIKDLEALTEGLFATIEEVGHHAFAVKE